MADTDAHAHGARLARRVGALESLLRDRGLLDEGELDTVIEGFLASASPANGARIVARAWVDPAFKRRLLADANEAITALGLSMGGGIQPQKLHVVENTAAVHNLVVCTLCSCYPVALLGPSPGWYKSPAYRSRAVRDPRGLLAEFGLELPAEVTIHVWDASAEVRYMVLPRRPEGSAALSEAQLAARVSRDALVGTAVVA